MAVNHQRHKAWFSQKNIDSFQRICNVLFIVAFFLNWVNPWFMFLPLAFWIFVLTVRIQRGVSEKKISIATGVYGLLTIVLSAFCIYALVYSIRH